MGVRKVGLADYPEIVRRAKAGEPAVHIAVDYGCSDVTIGEVVKKVTGKKIMDLLRDPDRDTIVDDFTAGATAEEIAWAYGRPSTDVHAILVQAGLGAESSRRQRAEWDAKVIELYHSGLTCQDIGDMMGGLTETAIRLTLHRHGVSRRPQGTRSVRAAR